MFSQERTFWSTRNWLKEQFYFSLSVVKNWCARKPISQISYTLHVLLYCRYHFLCQLRSFYLLISLVQTDKKLSSNLSRHVKTCLEAFVYCFEDSHCSLNWANIWLLRKKKLYEVSFLFELSTFGVIQRSGNEYFLEMLVAHISRISIFYSIFHQYFENQIRI